MPRREQRKPTKREWAQITSPGLLVRRIPPGPAAARGERMFDSSTRQAAPSFGPGLTSKSKASEREGS
jgi:hypothetical protein